MTEDLGRRILTIVTDHYIQSADFNGVPVQDLGEWLTVDPAAIIAALEVLIRDGKAELSATINPHIKLGPARPISDQLAILKAGGEHACVYPTKEVLQTLVSPDDFKGRPFSLELALGRPQLEFIFFEPLVLEQYRNDPRYRYSSDGTGGYISVRDAYFQSGRMKESDQVLVSTFGFAFNKEMHRAVAVSLRHLADLSPEHQQIWAARRTEGDFELHPNYVEAALEGRFPENVPIFAAFVEELEHVNKMCELMGRPPLFLNDYKDDAPKEFDFLLRLTGKALADFQQLLDKMMSDNLNKKFFGNDVPLKDAQGRDKGTVQLLSDWMTTMFRFQDHKPRDDMVAAFREVRKLRQKPAHAVGQDDVDESVLKQQRDLMVRAYNAVTIIRRTLANHPKVRGANYQVPDYLATGKICVF